jgi:preprotein translocase subunit YajC
MMFITPAYAQAAADGMGGGASVLVQFFPLIAIFGIMYFLLIRPQNKRMKDHRDMVAALRRGDTVVTSGGILGKVMKVADDMVTVEIAKDVQVQVVKTTITEVRAKTQPAANDAGAKQVEPKPDDEKANGA